MISRTRAGLLTALAICCLSVTSVSIAAGKSARHSSMLGSTPTEVGKKFADVVEMNFRSGNAESIVSNLSDAELSGLVHQYLINNGNRANPLLNIIRAKTSQLTAARAKAVFDQELAGSIVIHATPPSTTLDNTIYEIYLDFRTAPIGSMSVPAAWAETGVYAANNLTVAVGAGYTIGSAVYYCISEYDPELDDAIGGTIANMIDQLSNAAMDLKQGQIEQAIFDTFDVESDFSDSATDAQGDWGVSDSYYDYMTSNCDDGGENTEGVCEGG